MRKSLKALAAAAAVFLTACGSSTGGAAAPPGTASVQAETREQEQTKQEQTKQEQGEVTGSSEEEGAEIIGGADGPTAIFIALEADSAQEIENYPSLREMAGDTQIDPDGEGKVFLDSVRSDGVYVLEEGGEWSPRTDQMGTAVIHDPLEPSCFGIGRTAPGWRNALWIWQRWKAPIWRAGTIQKCFRQEGRFLFL